MKNPRLSGYIASALVPYNSDLSINEHEYVKHLKEISKAERLCAVYVNALVGEVYSLEPHERGRLLTLARETVPREIPIMSGVIGNRMSELVQAAHEAKEAGADIIEVMPPFDVLWLRRLMERDDAPYKFFKEFAREVKMPISVFKYTAERGLAYSNEALVKMADDIEEIVAMKTSCLTCADYYQVWNRLKGKLSIFVTGGDTVDMLGMMMIGSDGAQAGIIALGRENWTRFIGHCLDGKYTEARNIYIEKCAPIADFVFGAPLRMTRPHRSASTTALVKEALVA
ncbi:MAG: Dihydrodipicolinate synthase, partial [Betaproteobacteria bacterium]|nr:Dihydrodipicolinate synthase [Betaproteobacteria bacterium]